MLTPDTGLREVDSRVAGHQEDLAALKELRILIDGSPTKDGILPDLHGHRHRSRVLRDHPAQGQSRALVRGNFQALFESIELDQIRRGVLDGSRKG